MLTAKQRQLLLYIHDCLEKSGVSPSYDEMREALGLRSKSGIHRLVTALEDRGFIRRLPNRARALEVLRLPEAVAGSSRAGAKVVPFTRPGSAPPVLERIEVPLHGKIAAGTPIEALERVDSHIAVPPEMLGPGRHFALTVEGDSMVGAGILDGDIILVESCETARDGEIVVALVDNEEATLKRLRQAGPEVTLLPENPRYEPQRLAAERVRIQGRLKALLRRY
ncbi:MAG: transcriptional repressor LexA [Rhodothalassiaceae bacterium]